MRYIKEFYYIYFRGDSKMVDLSTDTIKDLFERQVRRLTFKSCGIESFDYQFSDGWF